MQAGGQEFESLRLHYPSGEKYSSIAQLVEHSAVNRVVVGSSPTWGAYPKTSGCGSVWLEHLVWDQGVAGSNPVTPTN